MAPSRSRKRQRTSTSGANESTSKSKTTSRTQNPESRPDQDDKDTEFSSFIKWANSIGIQTNSVGPRIIPGAGTGLVTTAKVKKGDILVHVPEGAMMNPLSSPFPALDGKGDVDDLSPQAELAAALCAARWSTLSSGTTDGTEGKGMAEWYVRNTTHWPTREMFAHGLLWISPRMEESLPQSLTKGAKGDTVVGLRELLPLGLSAPLARLEGDLERDCAAFRAILEGRDTDCMGTVDEEMEWFVYHWTLANTRSFAWKPQGKEKGKGSMVMCPVLDFVNHAAHASGRACTVEATEEGYTLSANRDYDEGEEIYACYGAHTNDKLFIHYGFLLPNSEDDAIMLDDNLLRYTTPAQRATLRDVGYEGNYNLDPRTLEMCFRTQVAMRSILLTANEWEYFMGSGEDITVDQTAKVEKKIKSFIVSYSKVWEEKIDSLEIMRKAEDRGVVRSRIGLVIQRWKEIADGLQKWTEMVEGNPSPNGQET